MRSLSTPVSTFRYFADPKVISIKENKTKIFRKFNKFISRIYTMLH